MVFNLPRSSPTLALFLANERLRCWATDDAVAPTFSLQAPLWPSRVSGRCVRQAYGTVSGPPPLSGHRADDRAGSGAVFLSSGPRSVVGNPAQVFVDLLDGGGAFSDGRGHPLDRAMAHVSCREHAGHAGLKRRGQASPEPAVGRAPFPQEILAGDDEAAPVVPDLLRQPFGAGLAAPMSTNRASAGTVSALPVEESSTVRCSRCPSPPPPVRQAFVRTRTLSSSSMPLTR